MTDSKDQKKKMMIANNSDEALTMLFGVVAEQGIIIDILLQIIIESGLTSQKEFGKLLKDKAEKFAKEAKEQQEKAKEARKEFLDNLLQEIALNSEPKGEA